MPLGAQARWPPYARPAAAMPATHARETTRGTRCAATTTTAATLATGRWVAWLHGTLISAQLRTCKLCASSAAAAAGVDTRPAWPGPAGPTLLPGPWLILSTFWMQECQVCKQNFDEYTWYTMGTNHPKNVSASAWVLGPKGLCPLPAQLPRALGHLYSSVGVESCYPRDSYSCAIKSPAMTRAPAPRSCAHLPTTQPAHAPSRPAALAPHAAQPSKSCFDDDVLPGPPPPLPRCTGCNRAMDTATEAHGFSSERQRAAVGCSGLLTAAPDARC